jgi:hypothetical protein
MKRLIICVLALGLATGIALAFVSSWSAQKPPPVTLPEAYNSAEQALGAATNQFYCVRAITLISRSPNGEWLLTYSNTNGAIKSVFVFMDSSKSPQVLDGQPRF